MEYSVGGYDQIARLVAGSARLAVGVAGLAAAGGGGVTLAARSGTLVAAAAVPLLVGVVLVVTGSPQRCPVDDRLGIDTA